MTKEHTPTSLLKKVGYSLAVICLLLLICGISLCGYYILKAPKLTSAYVTSTASSTIYDSQGKKLLSLGVDDREVIKPNQLPSQTSAAITSIEDRRFYSHHGLDVIRIFGAALANFKASDNSLQGGSTLDQQLIKLSYFSTKKSDQTLERKIQEAWLAVELDRIYSKKEILALYANKVFMGNGIYGMQTAAKYYYGKPLKDLSLAQTALLAGIPNAPSSYNPYANQTLATQRRNQVLKAMLQTNKISNSAYQKAVATPITAGLLAYDSQRNQTSHKHALWADAYLKEVVADLRAKGYDPYEKSLKVYTNLDTAAQHRLYQLANSNQLNYPNDQMQVAASVINPKSGAVVAMIGGRKQGELTFGLNRAVQATRSNASTAKPLLDYAPAIEYLGWSSQHELDDSKFIYPDTNKVLHDFDGTYLGKMTMQEALVQSRNVPAIRALQAVGMKRAQSFIEQLGFTYKHKLELQNGIGLPSSSLQNAAVYACFANGGYYYQPSYITSIELPNGQTKSFKTKPKRVMKASTAYIVTKMLEQVISSPSGTGHDAAVYGLYQAGKTGTNAYPSDLKPASFPANALMDSWFNGYSRNYSISVWTGYDKPYESGHYLSEADSKIAQKFYQDIMTYLAQGRVNKQWTKPASVKTIKANNQTYYAPK